KLDPFWGKVSFWGWVIGYWIAWTPIYVVGLMGVTRRIHHIDDVSLQPYFVVAAFGALIILVGIVGTVMSIVMGIVHREKLRDVTGDPWNGRTLEWSTSSPPPAYNFAFTPVVHELDTWHDMKSRGYERPAAGYRPIHMPKNTGTGVYLSALAFLLGFGMIWYIWWLAAVSAVGLLAVAVGHTFNYSRDYFIRAEAVARVERERTRLMAPGA
ncbi:MAG: cytochrome o ubiquinol oxidase subunit I, partial [Janthinobacterium lividum]